MEKQQIRSVGEVISSFERPRRAFAARSLVNAFGRLFPRSSARETVATRRRFEVTAEHVWRGLMFYEEVPRRPWFLLRLFLPMPVSTQGGKTQVGSLIQCKYDGGTLVKRITAVVPMRSIEFEVLEQNLGIEHCVSMTEGSYQIHDCDQGCDVVLTTNYFGHLRPRFLWQPFERYLAHRLHRHILDGMQTGLT